MIDKSSFLFALSECPIEYTPAEGKRLREARILREVRISEGSKGIPRRAPKLCGHPGCPALTYCAYCEKHAREHGKELRPSSTRRGYDRKWHKYTKLYLAEFPTCVNFEDCRNPSALVDHILAASKGGSFWDPENHQAMCKPCHDRKTAKESGFGKRGRQTQAMREASN